MKPTYHNLKIVGLLGGVASGKSFVARELARRGGVVLDADRLGHEVLREPEVKRAVRERWGEQVFAADGEVDRTKLARIVFEPSPDGVAELAALEAITHPRIGARLRETLARLDAEGKPQIIVLDAPILLKAGWNELCAALLFVEAPHALRCERALSRGWDQAEWVRREQAQEPLAYKRSLSTTIVHNDGVHPLEDQIDHFWQTLIASER